MLLENKIDMYNIIYFCILPFVILINWFCMHLLGFELTCSNRKNGSRHY